MIKRIVLLFLLFAALGVAGAVYLVPWNAVLEKRITTFLQQKGFHDVAFKIDGVGFHQATISNIIIGKENPLLLGAVTIKYDPKELMDGNLQDLTLEGLDIQILETDDGWRVAGIDALQTSTPKAEKPAMTLSDLIDRLPFSSVTVNNSHLRVNGKSIQTALPFSAKLIKGAQTSLEMVINPANLTAGKSDIALGLVNINAAPDAARNWNGRWTLESLSLGEDVPVPVMAGGGTLSYKDNQIAAEGSLASKDKTYNASFNGIYDLKLPEKTVLTVTSVSFPFKEGTVSARNILLPVNTKKNITVNARVNKVSLDALLQTLTGKRVSATGTVSGTIPLIIKTDGTFSLGKGTLKADNNGVIQMPGNVIPGDNEQVALVRQIVENLHYSVFSASVDTSGGQGMVVRLSLEGNNPDVYNGRIVKLNINLTGDVLDFIQQNAMLFTSPEKLLEQGTP